MLALMAANAQEPSYLPANAVVQSKTPESATNPHLTVVEQRGLVPCKGHSCDDESMSYEEGPDGKQYGCNDYCSVQLQIQHYTEQGKLMFDQFMQYTPPLAQIKEYQNGIGSAAPNAKRKVVSKDLPGGRMVLYTDLSACVESKYKEYSYTVFKSVTAVGTTVINLQGGYYSADPAVAEKIYNDVLAQIKKNGIR